MSLSKQWKLSFSGLMDQLETFKFDLDFYTLKCFIIITRRFYITYSKNMYIIS